MLYYINIISYYIVLFYFMLYCVHMCNIYYRYIHNLQTVIIFVCLNMRYTAMFNRNN